MKRRDLLVRGALLVAACALAWLLWPRRAMTVRDHATSTQEGALRVLFIGNSHTFVNDLPVVFGRLVRARHPQRALAITDVTAGGVTLADHLKDGAAAKTIARGRWDYVVLQEQSLTPELAPEEFESSVRTFDALVRAAHAKTVLYELWPRRGRAPSDEIYERVARAIGAIVVPVEPAWARALARDAKLELYQSDGNHPTKAGTYLAACVFVATLLDESADGLPPLDLVSPELATELQRATAQSVRP